MGKYIFLAAIFFLPWANLSLGGSFLLSDLLMIISFIIVLPSWKNIDKFDFNIISLIYIFVFSLFLSSFNSLNLGETITGIFQYLFIFIVFYISIINYLKGKKDIHLALLFFYFSMAIINIYTFLMYKIDSSSVMAHNGRLESFYSSAWVFALYEMVFLSIIYYFFCIKNKLVWSLNLIMFFLTVYLLILSGARSAIVTLIFFILILGFLKVKSLNINKQIKFTIILFSSSFLLLSILSYKTIIIKISTLLSSISPITSYKLMTLVSDNIDETRTSIYKGGFEYLLKNPITGIGPGNFSNYYGISMHNYFLAHWIENGLLALIVIILMYLIIYANTLRINNRLSEFVILLNSTFLFFMMFNPLLLSRFFWFPLLLSFAIVKSARKVSDLKPY